MNRKVKAAVAHHVREVAELRADRDLAVEYLKAAMESAEAVVEEMEILTAEARIAMFCSGAESIDALRRPGILVKEV